MARYEHLPIYRAAFDLAVHREHIVRHFSRYHKYALGTELRDGSRRILEHIIEANNSQDRAPRLLALRQELEKFKVLARLCHEAGGFASTPGPIPESFGLRATAALTGWPVSWPSWWLSPSAGRFSPPTFAIGWCTICWWDTVCPSAI